MKLTYQKIADKLGISKQRAHQLVRDGKIKIVTLKGGSVRIEWDKTTSVSEKHVYIVDIESPVAPQ